MNCSAIVKLCVIFVMCAVLKIIYIYQLFNFLWNFALNKSRFCFDIILSFTDIPFYAILLHWLTSYTDTNLGPTRTKLQNYI